MSLKQLGVTRGQPGRSSLSSTLAGLASPIPLVDLF